VGGAEAGSAGAQIVHMFLLTNILLPLANDDGVPVPPWLSMPRRIRMNRADLGWLFCSGWCAVVEPLKLLELRPSAGGELVLPVVHLGLSRILVGVRPWCLTALHELRFKFP